MQVLALQQRASELVRLRVHQDARIAQTQPDARGRICCGCEIVSSESRKCPGCDWTYSLNDFHKLPPSTNFNV